MLLLLLRLRRMQGVLLAAEAGAAADADAGDHSMLSLFVCATPVLVYASGRLIKEGGEGEGRDKGARGGDSGGRGY